MDMIKEHQHFAFNVWDVNSAKAVIETASTNKQDVILQTSASIIKNIKKSPFAAFIHTYAESKGIHAWLNIDHCRDMALAKQAIDCGWDIVMLDMSAKPLHENIALTNEITEYAHSKGVLVEAEIGQVKGIEDDLKVRNTAVASKADIETFVYSTNIDLLAVAFGNAHGEYKVPPMLDYDLVRYTIETFKLPFVVHGGSGLSDDVLRRLIGLGVKKINISTELKLAYRDAIIDAWNKNLFSSDSFQATDIEKLINDSIGRIVEHKLSLLK